jgi:hypothetical protein
MDRVRSAFQTTADGFPIWLFVLFVVTAFILFVIYAARWVREYHTASNIQSKLASQLAELSKTPVGDRKSLQDFLKVAATTAPASDLLLANLYVCTVNAAGLFFPAYDGIMSPEAVRFAAQRGARAFVFDIWPCLSPNGGFRPILQQVAEGSGWRRTTMNTLSFETALEPVVTEIYGPGLSGTQAFQQDVVILYLRFHGAPRDQTYVAVADALQRFVEPYRLDMSYNAGRQRQRLIRSPVEELKGRVVIVSNHRAAGTTLEEYINIRSEDGLPVEYSSQDLATAVKARIKDTLSFAVPEGGAWGAAQQMGIQCVALDLFNGAEEYLGPNMFGEYSYKLKPADLRLQLTVVPAAQKRGDPGFADGKLDVPAV